ncbi:sarcosine oxidase subunit beta family protein [Nitrospirillum sp. BR 11163]|uniref:sarcosine oxidase subunit beta family protein n=1 Tax=Nitrospirillum sp. BR 11163 TaxID=3104323 RepID=UPI002AFE7318|nr:sarcosine oxidase subunit beta family protein [Nitrospirillum sp. BR 11163]MEA1672716.1 sarcosine oxidase subunit beta family protein [Nitrospirillum sp. BR 11163]
MGGYSALGLLRHGLGAKAWPPAWREASPRERYRVVIIGGGGHGLATAYYLARNHGIRDVAVLEKGWIGGGNTGRNTTIVRSNYYYPESAALYDLSLKLYEGLSRELDYNIMLSQRGMMTVAHSRHELDMVRRWAGAIRANGIDSELLSPVEVARLAPLFDTSPQARYPVWGGFIQRRGGTARHDAVAWGYARAASTLGVDIIQNCEVTAIRRDPTGRATGVGTSRGEIAADSVVMAVAGHSTAVADMAGFRLPVTSYALQAMVSEPVKPVLDVVVLSLATGLYVSQSDKGEMVLGGALDLYNSYGQRGNLPTAINVAGAAAEQFPALGRLRMLRQWAGIVDVVQDSSPILGESPVPGLYINCGWGTGGFKAIPAGGWLTAHHVATGHSHAIATPFSLRRFTTGALIDEAAAAGIAH